MRSKVLGLLGLGAILALTAVTVPGLLHRLKAAKRVRLMRVLREPHLICILGTVCSHRKCWTASQKRRV